MPPKNLLTALEVESAKPELKFGKSFTPDGTTSESEKTQPTACKGRNLPDGAGLHLIVVPSGSKWWHFRYRFAGKPQKISLGISPT